jgi:oryzin
MNTAHADFGGRATFGYNAVAGSGTADLQGHGTHTGGIVGGSTYGVAKSASLVAVKVFDQGGSLTSVILDGYNWAVADIKTKGRVGKAVINMSLGGGTSAAFNNAVEAAYRAGIVTVVAAGNQGRDVGGDSPASAGSAITVGAVDSGDRQAGYSNYGAAVDIYASGSGILSTWIGSSSATNTMSGTSMACPHVTGLVLYLMAKEGLRDPGVIAARVKGLGSANMISGVGPGSPNLLAYNGN